ncbi:MAG TPA: hypothetical protein VF008_09795 [Niastella sp.]
MIQQPHPDTLSDWESLKAIKRGSMQAADDKAIEAYLRAIEAGKSKDEAGEIFIKTYQKFLHGK